MQDEDKLRSTVSPSRRRSRKRRATAAAAAAAAASSVLLPLILGEPCSATPLAPSSAAASPRTPGCGGHRRRQFHRPSLSSKCRTPKSRTGVAESVLDTLRGGGTSPQPQSLTEIYENEYYDPTRNAWLGGPIERWTTPLGTQSAPPPAVEPPTPEYEFSGDWKIDVTGSTRDELGWEYLWDETGGRRRRRWLRTLRVKRVEVVSAAEILARESQEKQEEEEVGKTVEAAAKEQEEEMQRQRRRQEETAAAAAAAVRSKPKLETSSSSSKKVTRPPSRAKARSKAEKRPTARRRRRRRRPAARNALRAVRDNWNFKGYGLSLYKSLIFPSSFGLAANLPLSINLDWWERRPALPSISSSAAYYFSTSNPYTYVVFLSASLRMEVIRFVTWRFIEYGVFLLSMALALVTIAADAFWRVAVSPVTLLLRVANALASTALGGGGDGNASDDDKPSSRSKKKNKASGDDKSAVVILGHRLPTLPRKRSIVYSTTVQERVGISASWRVSATDGYEFRISYWHLFLPTLLYLGGLAGRAFGLVGASDDRKRTKKVTMGGRVGSKVSGDDEDDNAVGVKEQPLSKPFADWVRQRTGSLGVTWGGPIPEPPFLSCSAVLSLSGYYNDEVFDGLQRSVAFLRSSSGSRSNGEGRRSIVATSGSTDGSHSALPREEEEEKDDRNETRIKADDAVLSEDESTSSSDENLILESEQESSSDESVVSVA